MKQGTWSVLLGCHSTIHSVMVILAWKKLYGKLPNCWETVCILLHDIGHWGKDYLDNYDEKMQHGELGAKIAKTLFGQKGFDLIIGHNGYQGYARSKLYAPDKYSWLIAPDIWIMSNTIAEPKLIRKNSTRKESAVMFKDAMKKNIDSGFPIEGHEIYLKQWGHTK